MKYRTWNMQALLDKKKRIKIRIKSQLERGFKVIWEPKYQTIETLF